jgi:hypothetical protein
VAAKGRQRGRTQQPALTSLSTRPIKAACDWCGRRRLVIWSWDRLLLLCVDADDCRGATDDAA